LFLYPPLFPCIHLSISLYQPLYSFPSLSLSVCTSLSNFSESHAYKRDGFSVFTTYRQHAVQLPDLGVCVLNSMCLYVPVWT
jgi:hypothetical protein